MFDRTDRIKDWCIRENHNCGQLSEDCEECFLFNLPIDEGMAKCNARKFARRFDIRNLQNNPWIGNQVDLEKFGLQVEANS